MSLFLVSIKT